MRITDKKKLALLKNLEASLGIITTAVRATGVNRQTYYNWLKEDEDFRKAVEEINEVSKDFVESKILNQIKNENTAMTIFYAKTKMKDRGYVERVENVNVEAKGFDDLSDEELQKAINDAKKKLG